MSCRILVLQPGIEPAPSAMKVQSPNHWTARAFPVPALEKQVLESSCSNLQNQQGSSLRVAHMSPWNQKMRILGKKLTTYTQHKKLG